MQLLKTKFLLCASALSTDLSRVEIIDLVLLRPLAIREQKRSVGLK